MVKLVKADRDVFIRFFSLFWPLEQRQTGWRGFYKIHESRFLFSDNWRCSNNKGAECASKKKKREEVRKQDISVESWATITAMLLLVQLPRLSSPRVFLRYTLPPFLNLIILNITHIILRYFSFPHYGIAPFIHFLLGNSAFIYFSFFSFFLLLPARLAECVNWKHSSRWDKQINSPGTIFYIGRIME